MRRCFQFLLTVAALLMLVVGATPLVNAQQSSSTNYQVNETFFGAGGSLDAASSNYKSKQAIGEMTSGNAASTNYQFQGGFNTSDAPLLEFAVNGGTYDMGVLEPTQASAVMATFTVRSYLISGYTITLRGATPSYQGHNLTAINPGDISRPGTEQFGVNLMANTSPSIGADPAQVPNSTFSFGTPTSDYGTANTFKFLDGDPIALSTKSSGQTNYVLSIIANIAPQTPTGQYGGVLNLQVLPTF